MANIKKRVTTKPNDRFTKYFTQKERRNQMIDNEFSRRVLSGRKQKKRMSEKSITIRKGRKI